MFMRIPAGFLLRSHFEMDALTYADDLCVKMIVKQIETTILETGQSNTIYSMKITRFQSVVMLLF